MDDDAQLTPKARFLRALRLPQNLSDEDCTYSVSQLITRATREQVPSVSLHEIHDAVSRNDLTEYLEPLDILPALLACRIKHGGASDLIRLCALHSSPKEVLIVIHEEIVYLQAHSNHNSEDEDEDDGGGLGRVQKAIGVLVLCSLAIPRLRLSKPSALELCSPILEGFTSFIPFVSPLTTKKEGHMLIHEVAVLVMSLNTWAFEFADADGFQEIKKHLRELLDTTVISCAPSVQASLARRTAEIYIPRSFVPRAQKRWEDAEEPMSVVELALQSLGNSPDTEGWRPSSLSDVMYLAHWTTRPALSPLLLTDIHHLLVSALQTNVIVDETLCLFLIMLANKNTYVSPDVAMLLCTVFTALASTHLDPTIRELNLRLLSLTLAKLPSAVRAEMLLKLMMDEDFPQIRGPAVGLLKEAVLEALALPPDEASRNPFASRELLRIFGGVLFRPNPPEYLDGRKTRDELAQSLELLRIADCLSFYYVLLQRDRENKTGVRSKDNIASVQGSMIGPLREFLNGYIGGKEQPLVATSSLHVCLDRIEGAIRALDMKARDMEGAESMTRCGYEE